MQDIHQQQIENCKAGNRVAQAQLYQQYAKAMFHVSLRIVKNREDAEDLLQEAFIDAFLKIKTFRGESTFGAWLKRIVINKSINFIKKKKLVLSELDEVDVVMEEQEDDHASALPEVNIQDVKKAMQELSDGFRVVFSLYMFEAYSHKEIAETLGISESTSKSQLNRAKKRLSELIVDNYGKG